MADERGKKAQAIDLAISQVDRQYGKGSLMRLGSDRPAYQ